MDIIFSIFQFLIGLFILWLIGRAIRVLKRKWENYNNKLDQRLKSYELISDGLQNNIQQLIITQQQLTTFSNEMIEESRALRTIALKQQFEVKDLKKTLKDNNNIQNKRIEKIERKIDNITEKLNLNVECNGLD